MKLCYWVFLLGLLAPANTRAQPAESLATAADSARVDTLVHAAIDSTAALDPAFAWTTWQDLARAIALRPLDGPEDIVEKTEIIEDRLDDLAQVQKKLERQAEEWQSRHQSLEIQLEVLDDLAELQRGGDLQLQQRMHTIRADLRKAAERRTAYIRSLARLRHESQRLRNLVVEYLQQADAIRRREEEMR